MICKGGKWKMEKWEKANYTTDTGQPICANDKYLIRLES